MADKVLQHNGYQGSVEVSIEDQCLHGRILWIDDLITYEGGTVPELEANFVDSVKRYLADCAERGKSPNRPFSGVFQLRVGPERHRAAARAAAKERFGLNEFVARAIDRALESPRAIDVNHHPVSNMRLAHRENRQESVTASGSSALASNDPLPGHAPQARGNGLPRNACLTNGGGDHVPLSGFDDLEDDLVGDVHAPAN